MNTRNTILLIVIMILIIGAYYLADNGIATVDPVVQTAPTTEEVKIVYCDKDGNLYETAQEAQAAGLAAEEYGATLCPGYVAAATGDYRGLTVAQATEIAKAREESFRIIEIDGQMQATTKDIRPGRINATVESGIITEYFIEPANSPSPTEKEDPVTVDTPKTGTHDVIITMTVAEAQAYAETNEVMFRTGTIDGEPMPVTMDYRPGRITAEIADGIVIGYTVE
jgi:hypothetical protein